MDDDEIEGLVTTGLQAVLALDRRPQAHERFEVDLHADSLDLVEVIERIESQLAARGLDVTVDADVLTHLATVDDAVRALRRAVDRAVDRAGDRAGEPPHEGDASDG